MHYGRIRNFTATTNFFLKQPRLKSVRASLPPASAFPSSEYQRSEMSTLIQNYNRVQKDEAGINRDVQNINNQVETLTNLGRSHAQALARHYTPTNLYTPFDITEEL